jgi:GT2 family glycosyltransferase/tetratricopeptide (TPR) repeat protein
VIVTCNAISYTKQCFQSLQKCTSSSHEIIVIDNGSTDGTIEYLRSLPSVQLIENSKNLGFPAAVNQGMRTSRGDAILLLNNDVIVTPKWLDRLTRAIQNSTNIGLVGPCSNSVSGPQQVPVEYSDLEDLNLFAEKWAKEKEGQLVDVGRLVGFCLMIKRGLFEQIGFLDERFGIGNFEDDDYCLRARQAGFRAVIARDCFVHHFGSATFKSIGIDIRTLLVANSCSFREKWAPAASAEVALAKIPLKIGVNLIGRPRLSLCMIVRDSARTLRACLESVKPWVDEMVIVDTGSSDDTPRIAAELNARVYQFKWCDSFSAARNESLKLASGDWIFWMDSDDTIDAANGQKLRDLLNRDHPSTVLGYVLQVRCPIGTVRGPYDTQTVVDHIKVFRNLPQIRFSGRIHEQVLPAIRKIGGEVEWTDIHVVHSGSDTTVEGKRRKHARDLRLLELEIKDEPDSTFTLFNLGMTLLDMGCAADAINSLCRSLQLAIPGESHIRKLYALLAQAYSELKRPNTAFKTCLQGLALHPLDPELTFRRAVLEQALGRLGDAEASLRSIVEAQHERHFSSIDHGIVGIKSWHNLAIIYEEQGRHDMAADAWQHVLTFDQSNRLAWVGLVDSFTHAKNLLELGRLSAHAEQNRIPDDVQLIARVRSLAIAGDPSAAVRLLEKYVVESNSIQMLDELCQTAFRHNLLDTAEKWLGELTRRSPENPSAFHNLAVIYLRQGQYSQALESVHKSLLLRPDYPPAFVLIKEATRLQQGDGKQKAT